VVSVLELLAGSGEAVRDGGRFEIWVTPPGSGLSTAVGEAAAATGQTDGQRTGRARAGVPGAAAVLAPALNVVFAGTVSVRATPVAPWLPVLA
jgi:hypothetical protein